MLVAVTMVYIPSVYWERIGSVFNFATNRPDDFAIWTRLETMRVAFRLGLSHPLLGVGIDNFLPSAAYYLPVGLTVHNIFLQIFSELGLVALSLFIGIIICNFRIIRRMMKNGDDPEIAQIGRALLLQHIAMLVSSAFLPTAYEMIVWFMLALPAIAEHAYRSESRTEGAASSVSIGRK
jgi:putative inorganic carbon (HCO3(-)) transporter